MCQLGWATGWSGIWSNIILDIFVRLYWSEINIKFMGRVIILPTFNVGEHHTISQKAWIEQKAYPPLSNVNSSCLIAFRLEHRLWVQMETFAFPGSQVWQCWGRSTIGQIIGATGGLVLRPLGFNWNETISSPRSPSLQVADLPCRSWNLPASTISWAKSS